MAIALGYQSALEFWNEVCRKQGRPSLLGDSKTRRKDTRSAKIAIRKRASKIPDESQLMRYCGSPIHCLVANTEARTQRANVQCHVHTTKLHDASFSKIDDSLYVSVPELAFLQMARTYSPPQLIQLGFEMCGTYAIVGDDEFVRDAIPLTSAQKLTTFLETCPTFPGLEKALRAARCVIDGSASPRETQVAMLLCLPCRLGGFGLSKPCLNKPISLPSYAATDTRATLICDLYWQDAKLDVEYDSDSYHTGQTQIARDARRRRALESMGITSLNLTNSCLKDELEFEKFARLIAKRIGKRIQPGPGFPNRHFLLRSELGL